MKKGMLFASGIALALGFSSCDDGSARISELEGQLEAAKTERDQAVLAHQDELTNLTTTYQYRVDSLVYIIDSLTAPKGTAPSKPKPTKPTTTTKTETPASNPKGDKMSGTEGGTNTDQKKDKMSGSTTDTSATNKKKSKMSNP